MRLLRVLQKFMAFRDAEEQRLAFSRSESGRSLTLGDVTTTNVTMMNAGVQFNVVHERAEAGIDMRVAPTVNLQLLKEKLLSWCAAEKVTLEFVQSFWSNNMTRLDDTNREWKVIQKVAAERY